jgi:hypothetical protein
VGQNITPKDDVSSRRGLKSGLKSLLIGNQKAKMAKGTSQYLQAGRLKGILILGSEDFPYPE